MADGYYDPQGRKRFAEMGEDAPEFREKFYDWYSAVFAEGVLGQREKALIGLAVAHAVQCPCCPRRRGSGEAVVMPPEELSCRVSATDDNGAAARAGYRAALTW